jgi:hypothetical protein
MIPFYRCRATYSNSSCFRRGIYICHRGIKRKKEEGIPVKAILAAVMIVALGITGITLWHAVHSRRIAFSSSQIYIHGMPVCVMRHDGEINASVGMCDDYRGRSYGRSVGPGRGFHGESPFSDEPPTALPPGHPPVDSFPALEQGRKIPI